MDIAVFYPVIFYLITSFDSGGGAVTYPTPQAPITPLRPVTSKNTPIAPIRPMTPNNRTITPMRPFTPINPNNRPITPIQPTAPIIKPISAKKPVPPNIRPITPARPNAIPQIPQVKPVRPKIPKRPKIPGKFQRNRDKTNISKKEQRSIENHCIDPNCIGLASSLFR